METAKRRKLTNLADDEELEDLLLDWGVTSLLDDLQSCGINYDNLELLEETDYMILLKNDSTKLGDMIRFRKFHRQWKKSAKEKKTIDVKLILKNGGEIAEDITTYFETNQELTDLLRMKLIELILKDKRQLSRPMLSNIAGEICLIFPGEVKRVYYEKLKGKDPTGLLYDMYSKSRTNKKPTSQSMATEASAEDTPLTDDVRSSIDFLNNEENFVGECDATSIVEHWETAYAYRNSKTYIIATDIIKDWIPLQKVDGYVMVHIDFVTKYGSDIANSFTVKWDDFTFKNQQVILEGIRNASVKKSVRAAQSGNDVNIKNRQLLMALHHLSFTVPSKVSIKNITWTPTIPQSEDSFLATVENSSEIESLLKFQKKLCQLRNIKAHPMVFELKNAEGVKYIISVGDTTYECDTVIEAIDATFKIYVIFKIPFPPQCIKIWLFLNEIFYKIALEQKPNAKLISNLNYYKM